MKKRYVFYISLLFLIGCSTVPFTGRRQFAPISSQQMIALGNSSYNQVMEESKVSDNQRYRNMVRDVGTQLSTAVEEYMLANNMHERMEEYEWEFTVLESDMLNAWCMPGGKIAFYEGIMPVCEDRNGVAVVMGHEIAHAVAQHSNERLGQQLVLQLGGIALAEALEKEKETTQQLAMAAFGLGAQVGYLLPYSRKHEREADELGLYFMAMAGYDPREAPDFWQRMLQKSEGQQRPPEFISTHPDPQARIKDLNKNMKKAMEYYNNQQNF
jgi:predicted Zn-dependent protease